MAPGSRYRRVTSWWWLAVPVVLTAITSYPITRNFFFGDDLLNIYDVVNEPVPEFLLVPFGGHLCIVRNAVILLMHTLFGIEPSGYHWSAVLNHIVNVALLCGFIRIVTDSPRLACFGGTLWGTAPVTEGTVGWFAASSHALATTALLLILLGTLRVAKRGRVSTGELWAGAALSFAASASFGVGIAWALVLPVIVLLLVPPGRARRRAIWAFSVAACVVVIAYTAVPRLAVALYDMQVGSEPSARTLLINWLRLLDLTTNMTAYGTAQLVLGPLAHDVPQLSASTWLAAPVLLGIVVAGWYARPAERRLMIAFTLLMFSTYGIIAAGRVSFYQLARELIIRAERYHYSTALALAVLLCLALAQINSRRIGEAVKTSALGLWLVGLGAALVFARAPFNHFSEPRAVTEQTLAAMQALIDQAPPGADVYIKNRPFYGVGPFVVATPTNFPGWAGLFAVYHASNVVDGHRVFFIEPSEKVRTAAGRGLRSATLLVAPESLPAAPPSVEPPGGTQSSALRRGGRDVRAV